MGLINIQIPAMILLILVTLFLALLVVFQYRAKNLKKDIDDLIVKLNYERSLLNIRNERIKTFKEKEGVLKREIGSCNSVISDLKNDFNNLSELLEDSNSELDHVRSNCSDFENEMGKAQLEVLELKDKNKIQATRYRALKEDNAELSKKLHSQKAHFGKQKKKIETLEAIVKDLDGSNYILEGVLNEALKVGYFVWQGNYHRASPVTAPKEKKLAREKLDAEFQKRQSKV